MLTKKTSPFRFYPLVILLAFAAPLWGADPVAPAPTATVIPYTIPNGSTPESTDPTIDPRVLHLEVPVTDPVRRVFIACLYRHFDSPQIIPRGAILEYEVMFPADAKWCNGAFDMESSPRTFMLRNYRVHDQYNVGTHPTASIVRAKGAWLLRRLSLDSVAGQPFQNLFLSSQFDPNGVGTYDVSYRGIRILDASGKEYWNLMPKTGELLDPEDNLPKGTRMSMDGQVMITALPSKFLYRTSEKIAISVKVKNVDPSSPLDVKIEAKLRPLGGDPIALKPFTLSLKPGEGSEMELTPPFPLKVGNYVVTAGVTVGTQEGQVSSPAFTISDLPPSLPSFAAMKEYKAQAWGADVIDFPSAAQLALVREKGGNYINLFVTWSDLEPKEGEYDFSRLDQAVANAAKANLRVEVHFIDSNASDFPVWTHDETMVDQTGQPIRADEMNLSYWGKKNRPAFMNLLRALATRYKGSSTVLGYQPTFAGWLDSFYHSTKDHSLRINDYSESSQSMFRTYVRDVLKLSLDAASQRYGLQLASWDDLKQPEPVDGVDLRPIWWDFQNYRVWTVEKMWEDVAGAIRSVDQDCLIDFLYGGPVESDGWQGNDFDAGVQAALKYNACIHDTAYEGLDGAPLLGAYRERFGVLHSAEPAGTPPTFPNFQQGMFNVLRFSPLEFCWIGGKSLYGIYPTYPLLRPLVAELAGSTFLGKKLGLVESTSFFQTCLNSRKARYPRVDGGILGQKLDLPLDMVTDRSFLSQKVSFDPATTPVLLLYGEPVLTEPAMKAIAEYAHAGGAVVLFPLAGRNIPGEPDQDFALLQKLEFPGDKTMPAPRGSGPAQGAGPLLNHALEFGDSTPLPTSAGTETWASFSDGGASVLKWNVGKGTAIMLGGSPDLNDAATVESISALLEHFGLKSRISADNGVRVSLKQKGDTVYAILFNPAGDAVDTNVAVSGLTTDKLRVTDLINQFQYGISSPSDLAKGISVHLRAYEVTVLAIEDAAKPPRPTPEYDYPRGTDKVEGPTVEHGLMTAPMIARASKSALSLGTPDQYPPDGPRAAFKTGDVELTVNNSSEGDYALTLECLNPWKEGSVLSLDGVSLPYDVKPWTSTVSLHADIKDLQPGSHTLTITNTGGAITALVTVKLLPVLVPVEKCLVAGPFPNPNGYRGASFYAPGPPESDWNPAATYDVGGKQIAWKQVTAPDGALSFEGIFPFDSHNLAYAMSEIDLPRDAMVRFDCGIDYAFILWVNGIQVFDSNSIDHTQSGSDFGLDIPLKAGKNKIAIKAAPGSRGWTLYLKVGSMDGMKLGTEAF